MGLLQFFSRIKTQRNQISKIQTCLHINLPLLVWSINSLAVLCIYVAVTGDMRKTFFCPGESSPVFLVCLLDHGSINNVGYIINPALDKVMSLESCLLRNDLSPKPHLTSLVLGQVPKCP